MKLSKRAVATTPSVTVELNARVLELKNSGVDIIKFNIGEPDFNTPRPICDAAKLAMDQGQTKYTAVPGTAALRQAIAGKLERDNHVWYNSSEICVTTGAKQALFETVMALAEEGDEVIIPTPCWVSYESMVAIAGAKAVLVPTVEAGENQFDLDIPAIERAITPNTRAIIINTPNNPTGVVYGEALLRELADLAIRHGILIISDEIAQTYTYDDFVRTRIRMTNHHHIIAHKRCVIQHIIDSRRIDGGSFQFDHIMLASDERREAIGISSARTGSNHFGGNISRTETQQGHSFYTQRGDYDLTRFAVGNRFVIFSDDLYNNQFRMHMSAAGMLAFRECSGHLRG